MQLTFAVCGKAEQRSKRAADIEPGSVDDNRTEIAAAHEELQIAIAMRQDLRQRIAGTLDHPPPADHTDALGEFDVLHDALKIDMAKIDVGFGADRIDTPIELDRVVNGTIADREIERLQPDVAILDGQLRFEMIERRPIGDDVLAAIMHLEIGRADLAEIDRRVRQ